MRKNKGNGQKGSLNKGVLLDLLQDPEVNKQLRALILEVLGAEKGKWLVEVLQALQGGSVDSETPTPDKKPWWKKVLNVVIAVVPYLFSIILKRKKK